MKKECVFAMFVFAVGVAYAQQGGAQQGGAQQGAQPGAQRGGGRQGGGGGGPREIGPQPPVVTPGSPSTAPSDAIVLFNGKDNTGWTRMDGTPSHCTVADGVMSCRTGALDTQSAEKFSDAQIHVEFNVPLEADAHGQARSNSGIVLQGRYEIQILDSYQNATYANGSCGALYGQFAPEVNACRPPEQWQSYDMVFHAPRCAAGSTTPEPGSLTIFHNGVLIQDHVPVRGRGCEIEGPLVLQDHGREAGRKIAENPGIEVGAPDTTTRFRNIWMRRIPQTEPPNPVAPAAPAPGR